MPKHDDNQYVPPQPGGFIEMMQKKMQEHYSVDTFVKTKSFMMGIVEGSNLSNPTKHYLQRLMKDVSFYEIFDEPPIKKGMKDRFV